MARRKKHAQARGKQAARTAPPQPTAAELVEQALGLAAEYPENAVEILREEATYLSEDACHDDALRLLSEAEAVAREAGDREVELGIGAERVVALEQAGRSEEARDQAQRVRDARPKDSDTWWTLAEFLEGRREHEESVSWSTSGISQILGPAAVDEARVEEARREQGGSALRPLFMTRHRVRRRLALPHDALDDLADRLHEKEPYASLTGRYEDLDTLHDPHRQDLLDPDHERTEEEEREYLRMLREQNARLGRGIAARKAAMSRPRMTAVLYWPPEEFAALCALHPAVADAYHDTGAERSREVEKTLRGLSDDGSIHLGVTLGSVEDFKLWLDEEGGADPLDGEVRARYGADLAARGQAMPWPPARNLPCWCGSGRKYKKCHGAPGAV